MRLISAVRGRADQTNCWVSAATSVFITEEKLTVEWEMNHQVSDGWRLMGRWSREAVRKGGGKDTET